MRFFLRSLFLHLWIFTLAAAAAPAALASEDGQKLVSKFSATLGFNEEQYSDARAGSTGGTYVVLSYDNKPFLKYEANGKLTYDVSAKFQYEQNPELYDSDRDAISHWGRASLSIPLLNDGGNWASLELSADASENAPQLTEYEITQSAGLALKRAVEIDGVVIQIESLVALVHSEVEDDDERPLQDKGYGREKLGRQGFGPAYKVEVTTYLNQSVGIGASAARYMGEYTGKSYTRSDYKLGLQFKVNPQTVCALQAALTKREKEVEMFNIGDDLEVFSAECTKSF